MMGLFIARVFPLIFIVVGASIAIFGIRDIVTAQHAALPCGNHCQNCQNSEALPNGDQRDQLLDEISCLEVVAEVMRRALDSCGGRQIVWNGKIGPKNERKAVLHSLHNGYLLNSKRLFMVRPRP
jgi:hypothetical protein